MVRNLPALWETCVLCLGWEDSLEKERQPTPIFLPGKSHGWRSLIGYSPWGCKELDTTEWLHFMYPARLKVFLDPNALQESHLCYSIPVSWVRAVSWLQLLTMVIIFHFMPKSSLSCSWEQLWFFYSYLFRKKKYLTCEFTLPSWQERALLFLPVCLKNYFHIFGILHNKQSIMIHLSLAASFIMGCGSFSFCIFASSFIPKK